MPNYRPNPHTQATIDALVAEAVSKGIDTAELELSAEELYAEHTGNTEYVHQGGPVAIPTADVILLADEAEYLRVLDRSFPSRSRLSTIAAHISALARKANS